jgi:(p)ppGpp synthase/HD superfamily hydrolase
MSVGLAIVGVRDKEQGLSEQTSTPRLTGQFSKALVYAELKHRNDEVPKPPWRERKQRYINHLAAVGKDTLMVSVADKLDNARSMLRDYHQHGPSLWQRFTLKNPDDHLWYYGELLNAYRKYGCESWMVDELGRVVEELKSLVES